ncbi:MAG TPA: DUF4268 domain-containing protein [Verrucomicrobiota bacterium]|nr:DUF4268 domain-containing protein [Verrucomicrobiota bacterium]HNU51263.1 DUF4268 domain-containing protein [Verrucomicrobiota bacterium]
MSDIRLFRFDGEGVTEIEGQSVAVEKSLQTTIEKHCDAFFGVRFLASEYSTGKSHSGRIDTLGIDRDGCPVIFEYKRTINEAVISQALSYLDWLDDHREAFQLLVLERLGRAASTGIRWSSPRLLCVAGDFTRHDQHAIRRINCRIELIRYRCYGDGHILFQWINAPTAGGEGFSGSTQPRERRQREKGTGDLDDVRQQFWSTLLQRARTKTRLHSSISAGQRSYLPTSSGRRGFTYQYSIRQHEGSVFVWIDRGKDATQENKRLFDLLEKSKSDIEGSFGGALYWERGDGMQACCISKVLSIGGYRDRDKWPEIQDAMIDAMIRLERALKPHIAKLDL